jgi:tetratricopeptide (TPR) repeat protein
LTTEYYKGELMDDRLNHSFTRWLFRPYLDLSSAVAGGPYHLAGIDFFFRSLVEDTPYPHIQACFNPSFRRMLIRDTGLSDYDVATPFDLPEHLATEQWRTLCESMHSFDSLPYRSRVRLAWTLSKMCFQKVAVDLIHPSIVDRISESNDHAGLALVRCYSRYRMNVDDPSSPYSIDEFKEVALKSPPGINRIDSFYQLVVQNVKHSGNLEEVEFWQAKHLQAINQSQTELDEFTYLFAMSRYHRVGGFIPQMRGQVKTLVDEMALAEKYALELPRHNEVYHIAADEVLYPVLESRTKEALWLQDKDLALERVQKLVDLSPYDSRAWLQLGEVYIECEKPQEALAAYLHATRLAPPGREIAWFMAGQCYEELDNTELACDAYLAALQFDPLGIGAAELLENAASRLNHSLILSWVRPRLEQLKNLQNNAQVPRPWPYQHLPPPSERELTSEVKVGSK